MAPDIKYHITELKGKYCVQRSIPTVPVMNQKH
jgi:hypothetical protein